MQFKKAKRCDPLKFRKPKGVLGVDWHVFDDHVSINENVVEQNDQSFTLKVHPIGEVKILFMVKPIFQDF